MSEVYLIIAAPWQYQPTEGAVRSLVSALPRCGLVAGPALERSRDADGLAETSWTWAAGPAVDREMGYPDCAQVVLRATEWLQPMCYPMDIPCPNKHPLPDRYFDELLRTGRSPEYHCTICGARGSFLDLDPHSPHYLLMASRLWLSLDHAAAPVPDCPALDVVRRVLGVDQLEIGQFPMRW